MPIIDKNNISQRLSDLERTRCCNKSLFFPTVEDFPETGVINTLYVDTTTGIVYVWNGTEYITAPTGITEDRFHFFNTSVSNYNPSLPLAGWTQPTPLEGATATIQFAGGTEVNYTSDGITWNVNFANIKPKVYKALLTQTGTSAPVATVLENTLGGTVVWTRRDVGEYRGTLSGAFPLNKLNIGPNTNVLVGEDTLNNSVYYLFHSSANFINIIKLDNYSLTGGLPKDDIINSIFVSIEVYP